MLWTYIWIILVFQYCFLYQFNQIKWRCISENKNIAARYINAWISYKRQGEHLYTDMYNGHPPDANATFEDRIWKSRNKPRPMKNLRQMLDFDRYPIPISISQRVVSFRRDKFSVFHDSRKILSSAVLLYRPKRTNDRWCYCHFLFFFFFLLGRREREKESF